MPNKTRKVPPLGFFLVLAGAPKEKVEPAMRSYYAHDDKRAGEYCMASGACTSEQLAHAMAMQEAWRGNRVNASEWLSRHRAIVSRHADRVGRAIADVKLMTAQLQGSNK